MGLRSVPAVDGRPDVLIVGAGGAGAVLGARLSADRSRSVLVFEAGPVPVGGFSADLLDARLVPGARPRLTTTNAYPAELAPGRPYMAVRGKVLGGSTTVNGGYFIRARKSDFARWAAASGDARWSYEAALPLLRRLENDLDMGESDLHGGTGPIKVRRTSLTHPAAHAFAEAARELGHTAEADKNAQGPPGFGPVPTNVACGVRINTGAAYLLGVISRPNLAVHGDCTVRSIVLRRGPGGLRATGVLAVRDGHAEVIEAGRVIVCAGAFGSAHLLQVSGIGPAEVLTAAGIQVVHDLPAIGAAFSDHPQVVVEWVPNRTLPEPEDSWLGGALHLGSGGGEPGDLEILQSLVPMAGLVRGQTTAPGAPHAFLVSVQTPRPLGRLRALSPDLDTPPRICYGYLAEPEDRRRLRQAVRATAAILGSAAFAELTAERAEVVDLDDTGLDEWIAARLGTSQHTCGTVPMGRSGDPAAAVDGSGAVHGVANLTIADTSILPAAPLRGPANSAVLVGEVIAEALA
ncbi:dehydrogenase [Planobispora rosea]|uniref:Dehydrogenase n=1 Tax=Planobispora rosea TaxID=35762 RepID=A0A8J3S6U9_PLARO|nr:mycofactocin system GMC family oxidoreductase MftG [Planobispora rosea]GGS91537.1 dehydrogenase [Planobispora rosea]GIH87027.1 dehydrogenase [Planobispora rosea]